MRHRASSVALCCLLLAACGDDDSTSPASALQVQVTIPSGTSVAAEAMLTVRAQDPQTRDDIAPAVTQGVAASSVVSVVVPGVAEGTAVVVRAVLAEGAGGAEVLAGEATADPVEWKTPVAITLAPLEIAASPATWVPYGPAPLFNHYNGSSVSGRASAILVDPTNPSRIFVGTATGGVWYSANGGADWKCIFDGSIGSLAFDPSDSTYKTIYVGTGEAVPAGQYGLGLFRITDDGRLSEQVNGSDRLTGKSISRILPLQDGTIFLGVYQLETPGFEDDDDFGVFVRRPGQTDFTNSFIPSLEVFDKPDLPVTDLVARDAAGGPELLAAVDNWSTDDITYASGIYTSLDGGLTWRKTNIADADGISLIYQFDVARISLAAVPGNPEVVYALAGSYDGSFQGAYVSRDFGKSWVTIATSPDVPSMVSYEVDKRVYGQSRYNSAIAVDPLDEHTIYVAGTRPARISGINFTTGNATGIELGKQGSLQDSKHPHVDHHGLLALATTSNGSTTTSLYDVTDGGAWMLPDATNAVADTPWTNLNGVNTPLQTLQYYSIAVDPNDHTRMYGGAQDNGSSATLNHNLYWTEVLGGDGGNACYDPQSDTAYVSYAYSESSLYRLGQVTLANGIFKVKLSQSKGLLTGEEAMFVPPLIRHPVDGRLALGTVRVYESTNGGDDWTDISGELSDEGIISAMAYHPTNPKILYVAESNTDIFRTTDGAHFEYIFQANVPELPISAIAVDANDPKGDHAWVAQSAFHSASDQLGLVFQTVDGGQRWTDFSGGMPNVPVWSLVQCTGVKPNLLFAGTDAGVYAVVVDGKSSWTHFGTGLPQVRVRSLQVARRQQNGALYLIAGTYGRGVYQIPITSTVASKPTLGPPAQADAPFIEQEPEEEE